MEGRDGEYYVQLDHNIMKLVQMSKTLGQHASIKVEPKLGELCVKSYSDTWYIKHSIFSFCTSMLAVENCKMNMSYECSHQIIQFYSFIEQVQSKNYER